MATKKKTAKKPKYDREKKRMMKVQMIVIFIIALFCLAACSEYDTYKYKVLSKFSVGDCISADEFQPTTDDNYKVLEFGKDEVLLKQDHVIYPLRSVYYGQISIYHKISCENFL